MSYLSLFVISVTAKSNKRSRREEALQKKREYQRKRREAIKRDPLKLEQLREKERLKYLKRKERKQVKLVSEMTFEEHDIKKNQWKAYARKYRDRLKRTSNF